MAYKKKSASAKPKKAPVQAYGPCAWCNEEAEFKKCERGLAEGHLFMWCPHCNTRSFGRGVTVYFVSKSRKLSRPIKLVEMTQEDLREIQDANKHVK